VLKRSLSLVTAATVFAAVCVLPSLLSGSDSGVALAQTTAPAVAAKVRPLPTNLQVLPRQMTGDQVHELMERWEAETGMHCNACHAAIPGAVGPTGKPRLNYADDSREEKATARQMYRMTEEINSKYIAKVPGSGAAVTCGTCHRGKMGPEPYTPPAKDHDHAH